MKILYINGFAPRTDAAMGGIFVTKRIQALKKKGVQILPYIYAPVYSGSVQFFLKKMRGFEAPKSLLEKQLDIEYYVHEVKFGLKEMVLSRFIPDIWAEKMYQALKKDLETEKDIDLIHLHWFWPLGCGVRKYARKYGIPYVITCHGSDININMAQPQLQKSIIRILEDAAAVEFVSQALLNTAKSYGYSGKNAKVVPNGIDAEVFGKQISNVRKEKEECLLIGYIGNLIEIKGADRIPAIFKEIYERRDRQVRFVVIGDGVLRKSLEEQMKGLPVTFTGRIVQEEVADFSRKMDLVLIPSRNEGYPCIVKEVQSCGAIPIGTRVGGIAEAIGTFGKVLDIKKEDSAEKAAHCFADAVDEMLEHIEMFDLASMIQQAQKNTWDNQQEQSCNIYKEIL